MATAGIKEQNDSDDGLVGRSGTTHRILASERPNALRAKLATVYCGPRPSGHACISDQQVDVTCFFTNSLRYPLRARLRQE